MLLVPWVVGAGVARQFGTREVLLLVVILAAFLAHAQAAAWLRLGQAPTPDPEALAGARRRTAALAGLAALAGAPLLVGYRLLALLPLGALAFALTGAALLLVRGRRERSLAGQLLAPVGLSLTAAVAHYVGRGALDRTAFALWGLTALFFLGGVVYVRMKITALPRRAALGPAAARLAFAGPTLAVEAALVAAAGGVVWLGALSPLVLLGFATTAVQAVAGVVRLDRPPSLKRVGILSVAHSLVFALVVIALA